MSIKEKDGFIIQEDNDIYLLVYMKLEDKELQNALPISYNRNNFFNKKNYLICIIDTEGRDYVGQASIDDINDAIEKENGKKVVNINHDYSAIKLIMPKLSYSLFNHYKLFVQKQLYR